VDLGYDRVMFIPANRSPHKRTAQYAAADHRIQMLELAIGEREDFAICDWEVRNGGVSYTIDTVRHLYETMEFDGRLGLIIGDDLAAGLETWKSIDELIELVDLVVMNRESSSETEIDRPHTSVGNVRIPIAASDIRERIRGGNAYRYLVPEAVHRYIEDNDLYETED
jgi:nicotinate-nucleotide adenylyltransferase